MSEENVTGRSVHQNTKSLEDAVASFIADVQNRRARQEELRARKDHSASHITFEDMLPSLRKLEAALAAHTGNARQIPRSPYKRAVEKTRIDEHESIETHESYGIVQITRSSSSGSRLFGSSVMHPHIFRLTVCRAKRRVVSYGESFGTDGRVPIIEIWLTPAQFVEMITTQNIGDGIPCTLASVEGVRMDPTPDGAGSELKMIRDNFKERVAEVVSELSAHDRALAQLLEAKTFNKESKEKIRSVVQKAERLLRDSAPFILGIFGEHTEKMAAKGKLEVETFIGMALHRAGIKAIRDAGGELLLGAGDDEKR